MRDSIKEKNSLGGDVGDEVNVDVSIHSLSLSLYICYIHTDKYIRRGGWKNESYGSGFQVNSFLHDYARPRSLLVGQGPCCYTSRGKLGVAELTTSMNQREKLCEFRLSIVKWIISPVGVRCIWCNQYQNLAHQNILKSLQHVPCDLGLK